MFIFYLFSITFVLLLGVSLEVSVVAGKTLVIGDKSYSSQLNKLFSTKVVPYDKNVILVENEELLYENVAIAMPSLEDPKDDLHVAKLVDYVNRGGNVMIFVNPDISGHWREFGKELGVSFEDPDTYVIDHHGVKEKNSLTIQGFPGSAGAVILGGAIKEPIVMQNAIGHTLKRNNPLLAPVLKASDSAYSSILTSGGKARKGTLSGDSINLVSVLQARNNARVSFIGSLDIFSEKWMSSEKEFGNAKFLNGMIAWTFGGFGRLRIDNVVHGKKNSQLISQINNQSYVSPSKYRIKDEIEYYVKVSVFDGTKWIPYVTQDNDELQLEITMLSPYYRLNLKRVTHDKGSVYTTGSIKLPDTYGVFSFVLNHVRSGYGRLEFKQKVVILPFRHDEYERFIPAAFPYYANVLGSMAGFLVLTLVIFYGKEPMTESKTTKRD